MQNADITTVLKHPCAAALAPMLRTQAVIFTANSNAAHGKHKKAELLATAWIAQSIAEYIEAKGHNEIKAHRDS